MAAPIVFLDVDGVLHPLICELRDGKLKDEHCFTPECMQQLKRIVESVGAEIVVSSSWRHFEEPRRRLAVALSEQGLGYKRWTTVNEVDGTRASQILDFVNNHARDCEAWVILDDEDVTGGQDGMLMQLTRYGCWTHAQWQQDKGKQYMRKLSSRQRFVKTNGQLGLTKEDADKAISILRDSGSSDNENQG